MGTSVESPNHRSIWAANQDELDNTPIARGYGTRDTLDTIPIAEGCGAQNTRGAKPPPPPTR